MTVEGGTQSGINTAALQLSACGLHMSTLNSLPPALMMLWKGHWSRTRARVMLWFVKSSSLRSSQGEHATDRTVVLKGIEFWRLPQPSPYQSLTVVVTKASVQSSPDPQQSRHRNLSTIVTGSSPKSSEKPRNNCHRNFRISVTETLLSGQIRGESKANLVTSTLKISHFASKSGQRQA